MVDALGTAASMACGIIEYLAEGAWTKRLHAGWAAQSGIRAALLGRAGFLGPRTVFEGVHGFFHGFANTTKGDYDAIIGDFGERWVTETLAFKPYPCGTMTHPYIDCARRLAARAQGRRRGRDGLRGRRGHRASAVGAACREAESGQRLRRQILHALLHRRGLRARQCRAWAISPMPRCAIRRCSRSPPRCAIRSIRQNPYPKNFTGHIRATLRDGTVVEERQPYMRGGAQEPLTRADIEDKFLLNAKHGGWSAARAAQALELSGRCLMGR